METTQQIMGKRKLETSSPEGTSETNKRHIISSCAAASKSLSIGYATLCLLLSGALALLWALQHNTHLQRRYDSTATTPPHQMQQRRLTEERRSLSIFKKKDKCDALPQIKRMPQPPIPPTYLATYPGSGSKAARKLIMALTGLRVQSEYDTKQREDAVVTQTRYPHRAGNLVNWDGDINRAVVLIRNPLHALPSFFDELYASKKHLPLNFQAEQPASTEDNAGVGEWASWRDRMFDSQMESYREFLRYWTIDFGSRGTSPLEQRLSFFCYEDLMSEMKGSDEAARLAQFLGMLKEVPTVELNDVPCVWDMIIKKSGGALGEDGVPIPAEDAHRRRRLRSAEVEEDRRQLASYFIYHPSSINATPQARPFTLEQLQTMANVLQGMVEVLYNHSHYLKTLLLRYHDDIMEVIKTYDADQGKATGDKVQNSEEKVQRLGNKQPPFHIFQVSPPGTESISTLNWLYGLFEPDAEYTKLVTSPGLRVYQHDNEVPITRTIVTQTNELDLIGLYKIFKGGFAELFFVLTKSGTDADEQIDKNVCEYDNVLCIEHQDTLYNNEEELQAMVFRLTEKFHRSFAKFFGPPLMGKSIGLGEQSAISRLKEMNAAVKAMAYEPYDVVDPKFGVHGGMGKQEGDQNSDANQGGVQISDNSNIADEPKALAPRRLFYCGSTGSGENRHQSSMGIYLANAFFPEVVGEAPNSGREAAILLTPGTYSEATRDDFLVYLMHQHCDVDVLKFPGLQLHVNHPTSAYNAYGEYTPPADNIFVIGAHEDGPHSIQLPYAMMKWWNLVKGLGGSSGELDRATMDKFFIPSARPKNTGKEFLMYVNSHYVAHREMAALTLSTLGQVHALGNCQANPEAVPETVDPSRPPRCVPYSDDKRPKSIIVQKDLNSKGASVTFQDFRFMLLMEDANLPGYITDRIVDGFLAGTIPIYYGTKQIFDIFNPKAFIYYDVDNPREAFDRIKFLEKNPDAYQQMLNEPILAHGEQTIEKYFSFDESIGGGALKKRVRRLFGFSPNKPGPLT